MSIRAILFLLFLYVALAWVVVALLGVQDGSGTPLIIQRGLLWTAVGIAVVFVWLIAQQIFGWWRLHRARAKAKPTMPEPVVRRVHDDDTTFAALIAEADEKLARAPDGAHRRVRDLPMYLIVGPDGAGKTSLVHNAGIDARLLAGQVVASGTPITSTRLANLWLANDCLFLEISGRVFQGDVARFGEMLTVLRPSREGAGWRRFWNPPERQLQLRGVVLCWDTKSFLTADDRAGVNRSSHILRERLFKIAEVFGVRYPVYAMFTKADAIPFFPEFFDRVREAEAGQPFGALAAQIAVDGSTEEGVWAEAETKRLNRDFNSVYLCLNSRRLLNLSQEPAPARKPAIYEFPREFKRIRSPLVQFLVDALRPDLLGLSPLLRGFFFSGTRQVEVEAARPGADTHPGIKARGSDATQFLRPDATQIFSPGLGRSGPSGPRAERPLFTRDFFQHVLKNERPPIAVRSTTDPKLERQRMTVLTATAAVALLLAITWTVSWIGNRGLINDVEKDIAASGVKVQNLESESLRALEGLRRLLAERLDRPHPWHLNWGLYVGGGLRDEVRTAYFGRLRQLLLGGANLQLAERLRQAGTGPHPEPRDLVADRLKTHLTTAGAANCPIDAPLVSRNLKEAVMETHPGLDDFRKDLINRQIDYYVSALEKKNAVTLDKDGDAVERAREFLRNSQGPEQIYASILAEVRKDAPKIIVREKLGDYGQVLSAPDEVAFEFTKPGHEKFNKLANSGQFTPAEEACVAGSGNRGEAKMASAEQMRQATSIYYEHYRDAWKKFLDNTNIRQYRDHGDAAAKLDVLSSSNSPLLGIVKFVGENTYFPTQPLIETAGVVGQVVKTLNLGAKTAAVNKGAEKAKTLTAPEFGLRELTKIFQPAHLTVHPDAPSLVTEKNKPYVDGLRLVQQNMDKYARASQTERVPMIPQVQEAFNQATGAERNVADLFGRETEGVNVRLNTILLQPIANAKALIPANPEKAVAADRNAQLKKMCDAVGPTLRKYPFNPSAPEDKAGASLGELSTFFAPGAGQIWKYQQQSLGDLLVKNAKQRWEQKPDAPKPQITPELLEFLNQAQDITNAFFPPGAQQPMLQYTLRPHKDEIKKVSLQIDGVTMNSDSKLRVDFTWPAKGGEAGAVANIYFNDQPYGFGNYPGLWGVFKLFQHADPRPLGTKELVWSKSSGIGAKPQPMTPVKIEIVALPGGVDVFNPQFFAAFKCPGQAVVAQ